MLHLADRNAADHAMIEFWVVATRPRDVNGFGLEPSVVATAVQGLLGQFTLLEEGPAVFSTWLGLVSAGVRGKRARDARLAAVALTKWGFSDSHAERCGLCDYAGLAGLAVVHPRSIRNS